MQYKGNMTTGMKSALLSDSDFNSILDEACERLLDRQVKYSIQRIYEMEKRLVNLEQDLDDFISTR